MLSWRTSRRLGALGLVLSLAVGGFVLARDTDPSNAAASADRPAAAAEPSPSAPSTSPPSSPAPSAPPPAPAPSAPSKAVVKTHQSAVPAVKAGAAKDVVAALPKTRVKSFGMVGVTWSAVTTERDIKVRIRTLHAGSWSRWQALELDDEQPGQAGRPGTEPIWVGKAEGVAVDVRSASGVKPADIRVVTIDPGTSASDANLTPAAAPDAAASTAVTPAVYSGPTDGVARVNPVASRALPPQPKIISRASWGASAGTKCDSPTTGSSTKGVVVHHTAGNNSYTKSDSAKIVRGDQAYHVNGHGWCDIGYNFLVDKYGQIFEGRKGGITKQVRAAHSGNNEVNTYAMGVSMMGNYDLVVPSPALKASMVDLISWRMGQSGLKAKGTWKVKEKGLTLNRIAGHRNVVSTACPGKYGYAWLSEKGGLRDRVEDTLAGTSTPAKPAPAAPTGVKVTPSTSGATVSWSAVDGAKTYGVCLVTSGTSTTCYRSLSGVTKTSASFADLKPTSGKDYYVKVRAGNESGAGAWSALSGFDLTPATPAKPAAVTGLTVTPTSSSAKIAWTAPAGAKTYGLCLQTSAASTSCYRSLSGLTTASTSITGLKPTANTDYFVKVRAGNGAGAGPWSALKAFNLTSSSSSKTATATAARSASEDSVKVSGSTISLAGHGFGHGIGMSQYGAQGAARDGVKYDKILSTYYQGTKLGTKTGTMRVLLSKDTTASVTVNGRSGLAFRKVGGSATSLPTSVGGKSVKQWRISPGTKDAKRSALQYKTGSWATYKSTTWTGDAQFEATAIRLVLPDSTTAVYRGALRSSVPKSGSTDRNTVNVLSIEDYVRGVVAAEMPSSWSAEALKAQAVAARTYGVRGLVPSRYYDMCDTTSCQVYRGQSGETTATDSAVAATKGKILTYKGSPAFTQYSSSSGGWTAPGSQPYLTAVEDPYDDWSGNGNHNWHATVKVATLQKAYPKLGTITSLTVKDRVGGGAWGGRVSSVTLKGSKASSTISGATMRSVLGLRSAWFAFS